MARIREEILAQILFASKRRVGAASNPCSTITESMDTDTSAGTWTKTGGPTTLWQCIDEARGSTDTADNIDQFANGSRVACVMRAALAGTCDVSAITIYTYGQTSSGADTINFEVSNDNSTWEAVKTQAYTTTAAERNCVWMGLTWTNPSYCYVRINAAASTFSNIYIFNLQAVINP